MFKRISVFMLISVCQLSQANEPETVMGSAGLAMQQYYHIEEMIKSCEVFAPELQDQFITLSTEWKERNSKPLITANEFYDKARNKNPEVFEKIDVTLEKSVIAMFASMPGEIKGQYCNKYFSDIKSGARDIVSISPKAYEILVSRIK